MRGLRRRRTLEALGLLVTGWGMLRGNLHNSDTILRNVVGDGRAQHLGSSELVDVHGEAFLSREFADATGQSTPFRGTTFFNVYNSLEECLESWVN